MSILNVYVKEIQQAVNTLFSISLNHSIPSLTKNYIDGNLFSQVSGLREAGDKHATIAGTHNPQAFDTHIANIDVAANLLKTCTDHVIQADHTFSGILRQIGLTTTPGVSNNLSALGSLTAGAINQTHNDTPFDNHPVFATYTPDFDGLITNILASNETIPTQHATDWTATATRIYTTIDQISQAILSLQSSSETDYIHNAISRLHQLQRAGFTYAQRAHQLATNTTALAGVSGSMKLTAAAVQAAAIAAHAINPAAAQAIKQTFTNTFPAYLNAQLPVTQPSFHQLLPDLKTMSGDMFALPELGAPRSPDFPDTPMPGVLADVLTNHGYTDLAKARTPRDVLDQFGGSATPDVLEAIQAGASPTEVAAMQAPTMPPTAGGGGGALSPGSGAGSALGAGQAPSTITSQPATAGAGGVAGMGIPGAGIPGAGAGSGAGGRGNRNAASQHSNHSAGAAGAGVAGGAIGHGALGTGAGIGAFGAPGVGANSGTPNQPHTHTGTPGHHATASRNTPTPTPATNAQHGMPYGGMPATGRGEQKKQPKPKAISSAVEREGNIEALLGKSPMVLPPVIGFNVLKDR